MGIGIEDGGGLQDVVDAPMIFSGWSEETSGCLERAKKLLCRVIARVGICVVKSTPELLEVSLVSVVCIMCSVELTVCSDVLLFIVLFSGLHFFLNNFVTT